MEGPVSKESKGARGVEKWNSYLQAKMLWTAPMTFSPPIPPVAEKLQMNLQGGQEQDGRQHWAGAQPLAPALSLSFLRFRMKELIPTSEGCHEDYVR